MKNISRINKKICFLLFILGLFWDLKLSELMFNIEKVKKVKKK